jgi:cyclic pyranopterin phosphate synthase
MALVAAGALSTVDPDLVRLILARVAPSRVTGEPKVAATPKKEPDPERPPVDLLHALGHPQALTQTRWASLRPLDRYALSSAVKGPSNRLQRAYEEIVHSGVSHVNAAGQMHMVGIAAKVPTARRAVATASVRMKPETLARLWAGNAPKGDVLAAARLAGIQAAKRTWELIPLCHPVTLTGASIEIEAEPKGGEDHAIVRILATVDAFDRTGVEMEALVAASTAALTLYDMLKGIDRWMTITAVELVEKSGGRSGHLRREAADQ